MNNDNFYNYPINLNDNFSALNEADAGVETIIDVVIGAGSNYVYRGW